MKNRIIICLFAVAALLPGRLNAQDRPLPATGGAAEKREATPGASGQGLPRFELNFPGGTPGMLVQAIQRATGRPLNVIIPDEHADVAIPPLKMKGVTLTELFAALEGASRKTENVITGTYFGGINGQASSQYQSTLVKYGFTTMDVPPREDSIWYFFHNVPPKPPGSAAAAEEKTAVRYFQLGPYLETYKVEDITTAIETGWRMSQSQGREAMPQLSFHKDTKLLIAVGNPEKLKAIDAVLEQLQPGLKDAKIKPAATHQTQAPAKSGESDKQ